MQLQSLYALAEREQIPICPYSLPQTKSLSIQAEDGSCAIAIDPSVCDEGTQERVHLGHELGHCLTGSFYSRHTAVDSRQRHENRANKWSIRALIPLDELDDAIAAGHTELWDLAEYFQVTEDFMRKAVCYYVHGNLAAELYF